MKKYIVRSFMICVLNLSLFIDQIEDTERGWDVAQLRDKRNAYKFYSEISKARDIFSDLVVHVMTILKWVLKKYCVRFRIES
jgi:hypothetical protein